jgi:ADP-ribosyl-[dinitrogen reductase] hydrolase
VDLRQRISGCLLAGAAGDALGAQVEFLSWDEIRDSFGPDGVTGPSHPARFTDDTQMTLFTVEGLIRAQVRGQSKGICHPPSVVRHAYLRWLHTQGVAWAQVGAEFTAHSSEPDGWLVQQPVLHRLMAPGNTCLSALRSGGNGTISQPANDSKGCGAVMRTAPVGFFYNTAAETWDAACDIAAITHGHPDGIQPAGVLAVTIRLIADGQPLAAALRDAATFAPAGSNTRQALADAVELADRGLPDPETLNRRLGEGWVGDEALAIAACCALAASTPAAGLLAAVNHSGDSDSTGSIAGNLLGAAHGPQAVPETWLEVLDGRELVAQVASDAATELLSTPLQPDGCVPPEWWSRYPGW